MKKDLKELTLQDRQKFITKLYESIVETLNEEAYDNHPGHELNWEMLISLLNVAGQVAVSREIPKNEFIEIAGEVFDIHFKVKDKKSVVATSIKKSKKDLN